MQIKKIDTKKEEYMDLLLNADPDEDVVREYLQDGDMYIGIIDNKVACEVVVTTENMIPFYVLNGFIKYHKTVKNFFVDNYKEEIWDGDLHCIDMYYYAKEF